MPYAEAMSLNRAINNASLAHRRAQKGNFDRYDHGYYPSSIAIPAYGYPSPSMSTPFSAPAHFSSPPMFPATHPDSNYITENGRRPPFKHMSTAPSGMYTLHNGDSGSSSWQAAHFTPSSSQASFHPPSQEISSEPNFWRLSGSLTSPQTTDVSLPPPRLNTQWMPASGNNYTHEKLPNSSLPAPHHSALEVPTFQSSSQQYYQNGMNPPVNHTFQSPPASHVPAPHADEHGGESSWPRTIPYRSGASV
jgi:hypothetical protein